MSDLVLLRLRIPTPDFRRFCNGHQVISTSTTDDLGYALHCYLDWSCNGRGPQPFSVVAQSPDHILVMAWADRPITPERGRITIESKTVPAASLAVGRKVLLTSTVLPYIRTRRENLASTANPTTKGLDEFVGEPFTADDAGGGTATATRTGCAEVDAFLAATRDGEGSDRFVVYGAWARDTVARLDAIAIHEAACTHWETRRLLRQSQDGGRGRQPIVLPRSVATIQVSGTITDSGRFAALLHRGLGRHRAFGFGMVLVRPA